MKRKILIMLLLTLLSLVCYSQNIFPYYSGNYYTLSFGNSSCAEYIGTTNNHSIDEISKYKYGKFIKICNKLNRTEENLLFGALNYYNYKPNEIYRVHINSLSNDEIYGPFTSLILYVQIQNDMTVVFRAKYCQAVLIENK